MSIGFRNVDFAYDEKSPILQDLSFSVDDGSFLLVIGQNGVGKSTLLKLLNGILKPTSGTVLVNGLATATEPTSRLAKEICVTFQNPADQIFSSTIRAEVEFGPKSLHRPNVSQLVTEALSLCCLDKLSSHHPYDLPAAERKLLTIASAVASGSPFLAFDEPSAGLSQLERSVLVRLLAHLKQTDRGLIVVSHDLGLLLPFATRVLILAKGTMVYFGDTKEVFERKELLRKAGLQLPLAHRLGSILEM
ncbi:MAG: energy-coupling factor ABC transporter ATP-binding protein [Ignavibacteriales bacterium]|nr:energy-coupling factor ABC transporter ATP-binding protein [Ignavibacteriales bacterium]